MGLGLGISQIAVIGIPLSLTWLALSFWLARTHTRRAAASVSHEQPV